MCCRVIQSVESSALLLAYSKYHSNIYPLYSTGMDESNQETPEPAWISSQNRTEAHEDII